jgi:DNA polymerase-3 subunit beta
MKVNFNRTALAQCLGLLSSVVPVRTPKPQLRCVKINAEDGSVSICATDLEAGMNYTLNQVEIEESGQVVVPADKLTPVVRETADDTITLEADEQTCYITSSDSKFTIYGFPPDQYPEVPGFEGDSDLKVNIADLQDGIEQCLFATAKESTRYALNGVLWEAKGKKLSLVATDGRRLAKTSVKLPAKPSEKLSEAQTIVPVKAMSLLDRISVDQQEQALIQFVDSKVIISCGPVVISSNLVEGNFPKYEDIIPSDYTKKLTLPTEPVLSAVRRSSLITTEESRGIQFAVNNNKLTFSSKAPEAGDSVITMEVEYSGEPVEIGFNPQFLMDVLKVMRTSDFEIELENSDSPALIKSGKELIYVLMPINLG